MKLHKFKKVALRLATLSAGDRRWVLRRLPDAVQEPIALLLDELLKITSGDMELLGDLAASLDKITNETSAAEHGMPVPPSVGPDPAMDRLEALLQGLPPTWAAAVLKVQPTTLRNTYLEGQPEVRRAELHRALESLPDELPLKLAGAIRACMDTGAEPIVTRSPHASFEELLRNGQPGTGEVAA